VAECITCGDFTTYTGGYCTPCYVKTAKSKKYIPSEGEEFIVDFLQAFGINHKTQVKINSLKWDNSKYRIADFYLPKYDVYIEFFGQWNTEENKNRYKIKREVYKKNNIPCIYVYPENLGILPFVFDKRLQEVLKKSGKIKALRKYQF